MSLGQSACSAHDSPAHGSWHRQSSGPLARPMALACHAECGRRGLVKVADRIGALEREGRILVDAASIAALDALVPTCPGWRVRELLAHVHDVHRWAAAYIKDALAEMVPKPGEVEMLAEAPADEDLLVRVDDGHGALVRVLGVAPAHLRCWTLLPAPSPLAMWARRRAHETAIHRVDAELAAGRSPSVVAPAFAADGVDELLDAWRARARGNWS